MKTIDMSTHDPVKLHKELLDLCIELRSDGDKHPAIRAFIRLDSMIRSHGELPPVWQEAVDARERNRLGVLREITNERTRQDVKWGGSAHDDAHSPLTWAALVTRHAMRGADTDVTIDRFRKQMVRAAALAVAAIESCDRVASKFKSVTGVSMFQRDRVSEDNPRKHKGQQAHDVDLGDEDRRPEEDED